MSAWTREAHGRCRRVRAAIARVSHAPVMTIAAVSFAATPSAAQDAAQELHDVLAERYAWRMHEFPETAVARSDDTDADRVADIGPAAFERRQEATAACLDRLLHIDPASLDDGDMMNYTLFERQLRAELDAYRYRTFLMPIGPGAGPDLTIPGMATRVRCDRYDACAAYLARLKQVPRAIRQTIELLRAGAAEGRTPPRRVMGPVPARVQAAIDDDLHDLLEPFMRMPRTISVKRRARLRNRFETAVYPAIARAMRQLHTFLADEYIPKCRTAIAAAALPDGDAYYAQRLRTVTTPDTTADALHEVGRREVARIQAEMIDAIGKTDFPRRFPVAADLSDAQRLRAFLQYLRTDERFYYADGTDIYHAFCATCKRIDAALPSVFELLPRWPYGIREAPAVGALDAAAVRYEPGDIRNVTPGWLYVNTKVPDRRPKYVVTALAMREAVPGRHLQTALAQELEGVPQFRRYLRIPAFNDGWALYAMRLGTDAGLYTDPYDEFGRLTVEMRAACALVCDTGIHAFAWPRARAVTFMLDHTPDAEADINRAIDLMIYRPAESVAAKVGELAIRRLRRTAEQRLGARFDLRAFHAIVLGQGAVPLDMLERRVHAWIDAAAPGAEP